MVNPLTEAPLQQLLKCSNKHVLKPNFLTNSTKPMVTGWVCVGSEDMPFVWILYCSYQSVNVSALTQSLYSTQYICQFQCMFLFVCLGVWQSRNPAACVKTAEQRLQRRPSCTKHRLYITILMVSAAKALRVRREEVWGWCEGCCGAMESPQ